MKKYTHKGTDLYISEEVFNQAGLDYIKKPGTYLETLLSDIFYTRQDLKQYIDLYGKLNKLDRMAVIYAHGGQSFLGWTLYDGKDGERPIPAQRLVNRLDGKYSALILLSCNEATQTPKSKRSLLVVPDSII